MSPATNTRSVLISLFPIQTADVCRIEIDGYTFGIRSDNALLLKQLTRALSHLKVSNQFGPFDLIIDVFSHKKVQTDLSILFPSLSHVVRIQQQNFFGFYNPGLNDSFGSLSFIDLLQKRAVFWIQDGKNVPWYEQAAPFRTILRWFFESKNYLFLHAACVGTSDRGILIVGKGGKGKTSTALVVLETKNLYYLSDDYTLVNIQSRPYAVSIYSSAKISVKGLDRFPNIQKLIKPKRNSEGKEVIFLTELYPKKIVKKLHLRALVVPEVMSTSETSWRKMSLAKALLALSPSTIFQFLPQDTRNISFASQSVLVKNIPVFTLELSSDPVEIGKKIKAFLH